MFKNLLLDTDSYKISHPKQYPPGTEYLYSYVESRGGKFDRTLFFGLQMWLKEYLTTPITRANVNEAEELWLAHGEPFDRSIWDYIVDTHAGLLPVEIKAVPEGMVIPGHNVLVTIVNTDPKCYWLPGFLETAMLRAIWYPTTVATVSWHAKQIIRKALEDSSTEDIDTTLPFKLHDFSARGVSSLESAGIGSAAHLVNFMGTDTMSGVLTARKYYNEPMAGFSIPAMEHQTVTTWGRDNEVDAYRNMLKQNAYPGSILACVSDSYNLWNAIDNIWGRELKTEVENSGATIVIRPDSGDPIVVPVQAIELLGERFGYTVNAKGYKVLPNCVRVIQGDGITIDSIPKILDNLLERKWSADNIAFGMGGGLTQMVNRDTLMFAQKCSAAKINGEWIDVYKDPITDSGKRSKRGRFAVIHENGKWETVPLNSGWDWADQLITVFENGNITKELKFSEIRKRAQ